MCTVFRYSRVTWAIVAGLCAAFAVTSWAEEPVTIVVKKNKAQIIKSDGTVQVVDQKNLVVNSSVRTSSTAPAATEPATTKEEVAEEGEPAAEGQQPPAEGEAAADENESKPAEPTPETSAQDTSPQVAKSTPGAKPAAKPAEKKKTPEQIEAEKKAVEQLAKIRAYGGAYYFDKDNKPLSSAQVDQMIKDGKIADIRARTLHQENWEPQIPDDDGKLPESAKKQVPESAY